MDAVGDVALRMREDTDDNLRQRQPNLDDDAHPGAAFRRRFPLGRSILGIKFSQFMKVVYRNLPAASRNKS